MPSSRTRTNESDTEPDRAGMGAGIRVAPPRTPPQSGEPGVRVAPLGRRARWGLAALTAAALLLPALPSAAAALEGASSEPPATVAPGKIVTWGGPGTERCSLEGNEWAPLGGTCYFAVDLLREPGPLRIGRRANGTWDRTSVTVTDYPYKVQHITLKDDSQVNLSAASLKRSQEESARVATLWNRREPALFTLPLGPPLARLPAGGRFGDRRFFNGEPRSPHTGADYAASTGTPVLAVADGTVVLAADHFFSGNSVFIDHGDGLISMSFHLSKIAVREGDKVERGQTIGAVGATGRATGPHLHFGVRWRGARIDPAVLFTAAPSSTAPAGR